MDRSEIIAALTALGALLDRRGVQGEMYLLGGAAIALAYDTRRSMRDIDAVFEPKAAVYEAAARRCRWVLAVAEEMFGDRLYSAAKFLRRGAVRLTRAAGIDTSSA